MAKINIRGKFFFNIGEEFIAYLMKIQLKHYKYPFIIKVIEFIIHYLEFLKIIFFQIIIFFLLRIKIIFFKLIIILNK